MEFSIEILSILFFVGILAGIIDTIAGGGGLITIPALLFTGMPPATALATNKLQSVFGTFTASLYFIRKKMINLRDMKLMIIIAFCSSILGGWALLKINSSLLIKIVPILLILIGIYFLLSKDIGKVEKHKIFLYKEDFDKFADALDDMIDYIETDVDFSQLKKEQENDSEDDFEE